MFNRSRRRTLEATVTPAIRANIDIPKGKSPANHSDIEVLFDRLPEPIDLEL